MAQPAQRERHRDDSLFAVVLVWIVAWTGGVLLVLYAAGVLGFSKHADRSGVAAKTLILTLAWAVWLAFSVWGTVSFHRDRPKVKS